MATTFINCEKCGREVPLSRASLVQIEWSLRAPFSSPRRVSNVELCEQCMASVQRGAKPWPATPQVKEEAS